MVKTLDSILRAVKDGKTSDVTEILEQNPSLIATKDERGASLLHWAVDRGDLDLIDLLLRYGVDANSQNIEGITALHWAVHYGGPVVIRALLQQGADPRVATDQRQTPLHWAVLRDPLIILVDDDRAEIIKLLLSYHADANARAQDGSTPLDLALSQYTQSPQIVSLSQEIVGATN
jgi:ankyrin repeat protein